MDVMISPGRLSPPLSTLRVDPLNEQTLLLGRVCNPYERGVFNGGSLFPSPFFVTSTQIDCDNS
jgi:hypothetical protein